MTVLDAGCGTGSITAGIAASVGPSGRAVGIDRDDSLIAIARQEHGGVANLTFEWAALLELPAGPRYDIVTAARLVQWISEPGDAIRRLAAATKPGGAVVVLDYNHELNSWAPEPPAGFRRFYQAFLDWRAANGWDNMMADHLTQHFEAAGLREISSIVEDEIAHRGEAGFDAASAIWLQVIQSLGAKVMPDEGERRRAEDAYREYVDAGLETQRLRLRCVTAVTRAD